MYSNNVNARAHSSFKSVLISITLLVFTCTFPSCKKKNKTVTDVDGNVYHTVKIGKQVWMVENLKTTHYRNGDAITNLSDGIEWYNAITGAYCSYDNVAANSQTYGHIYNWYAVSDSRNVAPDGWRVATLEDWEKLLKHIDNEGGDLKETGTEHWLSPNKGATNKSGFTALPAGMRSPGMQGGSFTNLGSVFYLWTSTAMSGTQAKVCTINNVVSAAGSSSANKNTGYSVRCIKE